MDVLYRGQMYILCYLQIIVWGTFFFLEDWQRLILDAYSLWIRSVGYESKFN